MDRPRDYHIKLSQRKTNIMWYHLYVSLCVLSHVQLFVTLLTVAHQSSLPVVFSKHKYSSGLSLPPPRYLPNPGIEPTLLCFLLWQGDSLPVRHQGSLVESKNKKQMNLFTKQKQYHRLRHQAYSYQRGRWDKFGVWNQKKNFPISLPHERLHTFVKKLGISFFPYQL